MLRAAGGREAELERDSIAMRRRARYLPRMNLERVFAYKFSSIHALYVQKATKKGRKPAEVDEVIRWLTGYTAAGLKKQIDREVDLRTFFAEAPRLNPNAGRITGVVCGVRVENVEDPLMQRIRYMDKLVDELAKGRAMEKILRA